MTHLAMLRAIRNSGGLTEKDLDDFTREDLELMIQLRDNGCLTWCNGLWYNDLQGRLTITAHGVQQLWELQHGTTRLEFYDA